MWLRAAAGLALLTCSFPRSAYAGNVLSFNDQQLTYNGNGWQLANGPQACSNISQTMHVTSNSGDLFTFNFTGNAIFVRGLLTTLANPMTVVLDGDIQPTPPPTDGDNGCGVIYANTNVAGSEREHSLTMVFSAASGSVKFSVSGIMVVVSDPVTSAAASPTFLQVAGTPSPTVLGSGPSISPSPPSSTVTGSDPFNSVANAEPPSSPSPAVSTSAFVTTPGMIIGVIGAIIGTIVVMLGLLFCFILLRRRITRDTARKRDQENSFGRDVREMDEAIKVSPREAGWMSAWGMAGSKAELPRFVLETGIPGNERSPTDTLNTHPVPAPIASGSGTRTHLSVTITSPQSGSPTTHISPSMAYAVGLGAAPLTRPVSGRGEVLSSPPTSLSALDAHRRIPAPLTIRTSSVLSHSHWHPPSESRSSFHAIPPGLLTASTSSATLHHTPLPAFSSPSATFARDANTSEKGGRPHVMNRTESLSSVTTRRTGDPPPGYF